MAQGYTRQSTANIVNGAVIDALYLNNEFNQIEAFANAVSGHTHDGSSGEGGKITITSISGVLPVSGGGTGLSGNTITTSGQVLVSPAAGQLAAYTLTNGIKASGTKVEISFTSSFKLSGTVLDLNGSTGTPIGLIYVLS